MEGVSPPTNAAGFLSKDFATFKEAYLSGDQTMWKDQALRMIEETRDDPDGRFILKAGPVVGNDAMRAWTEMAPRFGYPPMGAGHRTYEQQLALYKKYMPGMVEELPTKPPPRNWKPLIYTVIFITLFILLTLMWYHIAKGQPGAG